VWLGEGRQGLSIEGLRPRRHALSQAGQGRCGLLQFCGSRSLVDATIIAPRAKRVKHRGRAAVHGFKAHVGADADTALVEDVAITPANVNDGEAGPDALADQPGEVFADSAYQGKTFREAVRVGGGCLRLAVIGMWGRDEAETFARLEAWNEPIPLHPRPHREDLCNVEAQLWPSAHAMAGAGKGRSADPLHRNRLQPQALFQDSRPDLTTPPKGSRRSGNIAAHFSGPPIAGKADRIMRKRRPAHKSPKSRICHY
jgi:hypothetical protein